MMYERGRARRFRITISLSLSLIPAFVLWAKQCIVTHVDIRTVCHMVWWRAWSYRGLCDTHTEKERKEDRFFLGNTTERWRALSLNVMIFSLSHRVFLHLSFCGRMFFVRTCVRVVLRQEAFDPLQCENETCLFVILWHVISFNQLNLLSASNCLFNSSFLLNRQGSAYIPRSLNFFFRFFIFFPLSFILQLSLKLFFHFSALLRQ